MKSLTWELQTIVSTETVERFPAPLVREANRRWRYSNGGLSADATLSVREGRAQR